MDNIFRHIRLSVALPLMGSAILLISCEGKGNAPAVDPETMMTQQSDTLTMIDSENGRKSSRFYTPLMQRYEFASEPYMEFIRGVKVETYDSTGMVESTLDADYAIFFENQKLWEAKGNVVAVNAKGQMLETQQLFWNQKTKKIYSNVDSRITQETGEVIVGEGFESDEQFDEWTFRRPKGKVMIDTAPNENPDSTAVARDTTVYIKPSASPHETREKQQERQRSSRDAANRAAPK